MYYEIVIYSRLPADTLLPLMYCISSKEGNIFSHVLDQSNCTKSNGGLLKSLSLLTQRREPKSIIFVDSNFQEHTRHTSNYLPIIPYFGAGSFDTELIKLKKLLIKPSANKF